MWSLGAVFDAKFTSAPVVVTTGLVLYLDATQAASYPGTGTTWIDLSGAGNNGTLLNGASYSNGGIVLDGVNDYVSVPNVTKTANCTFSIWAKTTVFNAETMLFIAGADGSGPDLFFYSGVISWNTWDGAGAQFGAIPASANNGVWHNYVVVTDTVANNTKLYYDGNLLGSTTYKSAAATAGLRFSTGTSWHWTGSVGAFLINNIAFTAAQVLENFTAQRSRFGV